MGYKWIKKITENGPKYLELEIEDGLLENVEPIIHGLGLRMEDAVSLFLKRIAQIQSGEGSERDHKGAEQLICGAADLSIADMKTQPLLLPGSDVFCVELLDHALPSFVTCSKDYYGTKEDIDAFFKAQSDDDLNISKCIQPVQVQVYGSRSSCTLSEHYEYTNIWGSSYIVWADRVESVHIWIRHNQRYCRCLRARLSNLRYTTEFDGQLKRINGQIWGTPHIIEHFEPFHFSRLYVMEKIFSSEEDLKADLEHFDGKPILTEWLKEIFADG